MAPDEPLPLRLAAFAGGRVASLAMAGILPARRPRPIHSTGLVLEGTVRWHALGGPRSGIRWIDERGLGGSDAVIARLSRGGGFPAALPDVVGLAVRFDGGGGSAADLLVSTTGSGFPWRFVLQPRWTPAWAVMSTVMPYRGTGGPVVLAMRTRRPRLMPASMTAIAAKLRRQPWQLDLAFASPRGAWQVFAELELHPGIGPLDRDDLRFDAVENPPPGAGVYRWTRMLREPSYARARRG